MIAVQTPNGSPLAKDNLIALDRYVRTLASDPRVQRVDSLVSLDPRLTLDQYLLLYSDPQSIGDPYIAQSLRRAGWRPRLARARGQQVSACSTRAPRRW